jgi:hypothetical protein
MSDHTWLDKPALFLYVLQECFYLFMSRNQKGSGVFDNALEKGPPFYQPWSEKMYDQVNR